MLLIWTWLKCCHDKKLVIRDIEDIIGKGRKKRRQAEIAGSILDSAKLFSKLDNDLGTG